MKIYKSKLDSNGNVIIEVFGRYEENATITDSENLLLNEKESNGYIFISDNEKPIYIANTQNDLKDITNNLIDITAQLIELCNINVVKLPSSSPVPLSPEIKQQLTDLNNTLKDYKFT